MILVIGGHSSGKMDFVKEYLNYNFEKDNVINDINVLAEEMFESGMDYETAANNIYARCRVKIVLTDEIGNGIVPMDASKRDFREWMGRLQIILAKKSDEVYRVICGMGQKIK
ncbi:MAG: bifunctional adenosylcobinamide kinase/adenosylcobinamide-phosphate guanylyltransferase [Lachnospiraceae bacterium]|nr:bifunctional adenosylcobinamide kinase/adenosylcobinamide-phosphate guanylyltransferase [Lachnospiraceae bacterium]